MLDRQTSSVMSGIRRDHVARYEFARLWANGEHGPILDAACGIGYGSFLLATDGHEVTAVDISPAAIEMGRQHYDTENIVRWIKGDILKRPWGAETFNTIVSFETLEHLPEAPKALRHFKESLRPGGILVCSVPNELKYPFIAEKFAMDEYPHLRHYTPQDFTGLLNDAGFDVIYRGSQEDKQSDVKVGTAGMFLVFVCRPFVS